MDNILNVVLNIPLGTVGMNPENFRGQIRDSIFFLTVYSLVSYLESSPPVSFVFLLKCEPEEKEALLKSALRE